MRRKILVMLLACLILFNGATAFAVNNNTSKSNLINTQNSRNSVILMHTDNKLTYTYEEDGQRFLVEETFDSDMTDINSDIYIIHGNTKTLLKTLNTQINKLLNEVSVYQNNELVEKHELNGLFSISYVEPGKDLINKKTRNSDPWSHLNWHHQYSINSHVRLDNMTIAGILGALGALIGNPVLGALLGIATTLFNNRSENAYYSMKSYLNLDFDNNDPSTGPLIKNEYVFYADRNRTIEIGKEIEYIWYR